MYTKSFCFINRLVVSIIISPTHIYYELLFSKLSNSNSSCGIMSKTIKCHSKNICKYKMFCKCSFFILIISFLSCKKDSTTVSKFDFRWKLKLGSLSAKANNLTVSCVYIECQECFPNFPSS